MPIATNLAELIEWATDSQMCEAEYSQALDRDLDNLLSALRDNNIEDAAYQVIAMLMDDWERYGFYTGQSGYGLFSQDDWQEIERRFPTEHRAQGYQIALRLGLTEAQ